MDCEKRCRNEAYHHFYHHHPARWPASNCTGLARSGRACLSFGASVAASAGQRNRLAGGRDPVCKMGSAFHFAHTPSDPAAEREGVSTRACSGDRREQFRSVTSLAIPRRRARRRVDSQRDQDDKRKLFPLVTSPAISRLRTRCQASRGRCASSLRLRMMRACSVAETHRNGRIGRHYA